MQVFLPRLPAPAAFADPARTIASSCGRALITYDPETRAGAVYHVDEARWSFLTPVTFGEFVESVAISGLRISDSPASAAWFRSNTVVNAGGLH